MKMLAGASWILAFIVVGSTVVWAQSRGPVETQSPTSFSGANYQTTNGFQPTGRKSMQRKDLNRLKSGEHTVKGSVALAIDSSRVALDRNEAKWLEERGFMSADKFVKLQNSSFDELKAKGWKTADGDARSALGFKYLRDGNFDAARAAFIGAAAAGSLYAIEMLANTELAYYYQLKPKSVMNAEIGQLRFLAYMQVARDLGDHRMQGVISSFKRLNTTKAFQDAVDEQTKNFKKALEQDWNAMPNRKKISPVERPNRAQWERAEQNKNDDVKIIIL